MKFALKDIKPNPFRQLNKYPVVPAKVDKLKKSIKQTGFWDNVVARIVDGKPELSHGHNRLAALRDLYGPKHEVDLIIRDFSDAKMIQSMAAENDEDFGSNLSVFFESVKAAVQALGEGRITAEEMPLDMNEKTNLQYIRQAPSFVPGRPSAAPGATHPYTAESLANFLGILKPDGEAPEKLRAVLNALELIERKIITERDTENLGVKTLLKMTQDKKREHVIRVERLEKARLDAKALQEKQSALDAQRREQEKKDREIEQSRLREVAAAKLEKDKAELAELEAEKKRNFERSQKRYAEIQEKRKVLDAKIEDNIQRQEAFKPKPEAEIRVQGVSALRFKFDVIYSESSGLVKESEVMGRNNNLTPEERETLRQAMLKAGERLRYGAENFLPPGTARMATKALREKTAKGNAEKFFKSNKGDKK